MLMKSEQTLRRKYKQSDINTRRYMFASKMNLTYVKHTHTYDACRAGLYKGHACLVMNKHEQAKRTGIISVMTVLL